MRWKLEIGPFEFGANAKWYGFAYHRTDHLVDVYYPIPFNLAVRAARELWRAAQRGLWRSAYEKSIAQAYHDGFQKGYLARMRETGPHHKAIQAIQEYALGIADEEIQAGQAVTLSQGDTQ